ncbi:MAG: ABC transporter ATP-binding protein [Patescibacteria group bacterium]|jgi:ATP-binding cassette subfamily B protein
MLDIISRDIIIEGSNKISGGLMLAMDKEVVSTAAVRQVLNDYGRQYKQHPWHTVVALFAPAIGNIFVFFIPPLIIGRIINILVQQNEISLGAVLNLVILFGGLWMLGEMLWRIGVYSLIAVEAKGLNTLSREAFRKLVNRDYEFYTDNFVGSLTKKSLAYARNFEIFTDTLSMNIGTSFIPMIFAIVVMWGYSPWIPLALIFALLITLTISIPKIRHRARLVALRHEASSKMAGRLSDAMTNILGIKSFAKEKRESTTFGKYADDFAAKFKRAADHHNLKIDLILSPIYVVTNVLGLVLAIYFVHKLSLQAGTIVVVFSYYMQVTRVFWEINRIYRHIESSLGEAAEFTQMFLHPPTVEDVPNARALRLEDAKISFESANFRYTDDSEKKKLFLKDFSLDVLGKQKVGLIGPSGSGKTTITKLLLRFVNLQSGAIKIDGQDISQVTQESLRRAIAYVPQEPMLFHRSLMENIAYSNDKATKAEVMKAAKLARAHEFIVTLPNGYNTLVGERGIKLSGGQRQRIAIARAILKKAPILVLDEATSSLDSESEKYIQDGLKELMKGKTVIVIAHRLSTIRHLDRIVVLDKGKISQDGTHEQLMKEEGLYSALWNHQSGGFMGKS